MVGDGAPSDGGIPNGARLIRFATAVLGNEPEELAAARDDLAAAMGGAALLGELVTRELLVAGALILSGIAMTLKR